jgi:hypothetical protein
VPLAVCRRRRRRQLGEYLQTNTDFYARQPNSYEAAKKRAEFLKDAIENKGCHRIFHVKGKPIEREADLQILYRLTWFGTTLDVTREANDGRGPVDFKVSKGARDKSLVEMKLASNTSLERNLKNQTAVYSKASDAKRSITVIVCFSAIDQRRVQTILKKLKRENDEHRCHRRSGRQQAVRLQGLTTLSSPMTPVRCAGRLAVQTTVIRRCRRRCVTWG